MIRKHEFRAGVFSPSPPVPAAPSQPAKATGPVRPEKTWERLFRLACLLPVVVTAVLGGYFVNQARYDGETYHSKPVSYPYRWHAQWITDKQPVVAMSVRKTFFCSGGVASGYLAVVGDNFYTLRINGARVTPFFSPSMNTGTYVNGGMETPDTEVGNDQYSNIAQIYDIGPYVRSGYNSIAIRVQSDRGQPKVLLQGRINRFSGAPIDLVSDGSWKSSLTPNSEQFSWYASAYDDSDWPLVATTAGPMDRRIDGDPSMFMAPPGGAYIGGPTTSLNGAVLLQKHLAWNEFVSDGWMRLSTTVPFDITLNGQLLNSTSTQMDYVPMPFSQLRSIDILERMRYTPIPGRHTGMNVQVPMYAYALRNVFRRGDNVLTVTLQDQSQRNLRTVPTLLIDGQVTGPDGRRMRFGTDSTWQAGVFSGNQVVWSPARVSTVISARTASGMPPSLAAIVYSRSNLYQKVAVNAALFLVALLLVGYGVAVRMPAVGKEISLAQKIGAPFLLPATALTCCICLEAAFVFSPQNIFFATTQFALIALGLTAATYCLVVLLPWITRRTPAVSATVVPAVSTDASGTTPSNRGQLAQARAFAGRFGPAIVVGALMLLSGFISTHAISVNPFIDDEYVSILCARGILHTGKPLFEGSGVIYGRSALYHYLLAPFVAYGYSIDQLSVTRYLSAIWQVAMIPLCYLFAREMKGRRAGLAAAALVSISPYLLYFARETRFYAQYAFFSTLTFYLLYKAIRNPDRPWYRVGVLLAFAGAYHSQELAISMVPPMIIVVLTSGQIKLWLQKLPLFVMGLVAASIACDMFVYFHYTVTPLPYVDRDAMPLLALHTDQLEVLASMVFLSYSRTQVPLFLLFGAGLLWELVRVFKPRSRQDAADTTPWPWHVYMYTTTLVSLATLSVILPVAGVRYAVSVIPPVLVTSACIAVAGADRIARWLRESTGSARTGQVAAVTFAILIGLMALIAYRPLRTYDSTERVLNRDHTGAARYVAAHAFPDDKLMFFNPQSALVECGRCDYNWTTVMKSLYKYVGRDGRLRERDSGTLVIDNVDKLRQVVSENRRVWLVTVPVSIGSGGMSTFVYNNFVLVHETYGVQVWLWDRDRNVYRSTTPDLGYGHVE